MPRLVTMSGDGRFVALRRKLGDVEVIEWIDATGRRGQVRAPEALDFVCVGDELWVVLPARLDRYRLARAADLALATPLATAERARLVGHADGAVAVVCGMPSLLVCCDDARVDVFDVSAHLYEQALVFPLGGRRIAAVHDGAIAVIDAGKGIVGSAAWPSAGSVWAGGVVFGGRALALASTAPDGVVIDVVQIGDGKRIHRIEVGHGRAFAVAPARGVAVIAEKQRVVAVDLQFGKRLAEAACPLDVRELAIYKDARWVALAGQRAGDTAVLHFDFADLFEPQRTSVRPRAAPRRSVRPQRRGESRANPSRDDIELPAGDVLALRPIADAPSDLAAWLDWVHARAARPRPRIPHRAAQRAGHRPAAARRCVGVVGHHRPSACGTLAPARAAGRARRARARRHRRAPAIARPSSVDRGARRCRPRPRPS